MRKLKDFEKIITVEKMKVKRNIFRERRDSKSIYLVCEAACAKAVVNVHDSDPGHA